MKITFLLNLNLKKNQTEHVNKGLKWSGSITNDLVHNCIFPTMTELPLSDKSEPFCKRVFLDDIQTG